jgi:SOS response regulatory protein OraA/RecX
MGASAMTISQEQTDALIAIGSKRNELRNSHDHLSKTPNQSELISEVMQRLYKVGLLKDADYDIYLSASFPESNKCQTR